MYRGRIVSYRIVWSGRRRNLQRGIQNRMNICVTRTHTRIGRIKFHKTGDATIFSFSFGVIRMVFPSSIRDTWWASIGMWDNNTCCSEPFKEDALSPIFLRRSTLMKLVEDLSQWWWWRDAIAMQLIRRQTSWWICNKYIEEDPLGGNRARMWPFTLASRNCVAPSTLSKNLNHFPASPSIELNSSEKHFWLTHSKIYFPFILKINNEPILLALQIGHY